METSFCVSELDRTLAIGTPEIFNTDQGAQFTSNEITGVLQDHEIAISMDGKGRAVDNVFVERLWWPVKYEDVYPRANTDGKPLYKGLERYFKYYNEEQKHSFLDKRTPAEVFRQGAKTN